MAFGTHAGVRLQAGPPKLTGTLRLKNTSANQAVRLVAGKIQYISGVT